MKPWLETGIVVLLALSGAGVGYLCSRLRKPYFLLGSAPALAFAVAVGLARRHSMLAFKLPFSWVTRDHNEFYLMAFAWTMPMATLIPHLSRKRQRWLAGVLTVLAVAHVSVLPFLCTALVWGKLASLETTMTEDGVCLQSTGYTCGPAAAVAALNLLGLEAQESELAMLARSNAIAGTDADALCAAIEKRYGPDGVSCVYRRFQSISDLQEDGAVIAVVKHALLVDHYVAVIGVTDDKVVLADPIRGKRTLSHEEFEGIWRRRGIVLTRDRSQ